MPVVVVESPAKAKTIKKYLGKDYTVMASFGHVRDLPPRDGSVDPDRHFQMKWEVPKSSGKRIQDIAAALKQDQDLILATDPDREGEAISWHIQEVLRRKRGFRLDGDPKRVVFNSVTESSVRQALETPRKIDMELVDAYLARRALDYLVGYRLSPVLWRKLPGARSAGRVQSVCVRIVVEREYEIEAFKKTEYWTVTAEFTTADGETFSAQLARLGGSKLGKFDLSSETDAARAAGEIKAREFSVASVQTKPSASRPPPPFMTATLQQEASRKLRMPPGSAMRTAQKLYEQGLITYMRTDAVFMAPEGVAAARQVILDRFGADYLPKSPRVYKSRAKNAQEAHECIRPTSPGRDSNSAGITDSDQKRLYELIWNRTIASQMQSARFLQTSADILSADAKVGLRASGRVTKFKGYQAVYQESRDDSDSAADDGAEGISGAKAPLPPLREGDALTCGEVAPHQHFTKPPPRYSEAALVKKMVELGIGRPSTYSSIVSTIQDRGYVSRKSGRLVPEPVGRLLVCFLKIYFSRYVEFKFTADLEQDLDDIASGRKQRQQVLDGFWGDFSSAVESAQGLRIGEVLDRLSDIVVPMLLPAEDGRSDARQCPRCDNGKLTLRVSRRNATIGCSNSPDCSFRMGIDGNEARSIGTDPASGEPISLLVGSYGPYLQIGSAAGRTEKPKRAGIPKDVDTETLDLVTALALLDLPRTVGRHPEDKEPIEAGIGPFGPYLRHAGKYARLANTSEALTIGMNSAVEKLAQSRARRRPGPQGRTVGDHPEGGPVTAGAGKYGPYVKWKRVYASIPKGVDPGSVGLEDAVKWLAAKKKGNRK